MRIRSAAKTHVGLVRANNEDSYLPDSASQVWAVADGMGGHAAGEIASKLAVKALSRNVHLLPDNFASAFDAAHALILNRIRMHPEQAGMGTTLTALCIRGNVATVAHVGDSRCYLVRDGKGEQLTQDHVLGPHVLSNCLGNRPGSHVRTDIIRQNIKAGDVLILCSDGLSNSVPASDFALAAKLYAGNLPELCDSLIHLELKRDGADNITVVAVAVEAD